ncbi:MAG: type VI secretion system amidase effector protein Tae4, partial [Desulfobulbia bacterium]
QTRSGLMKRRILSGPCPGNLSCLRTVGLIIVVFTIQFSLPNNSNAQGTLKFRELWTNHPLNNSVAYPARMLKNVTSNGVVVKRKGTPSFPNQCAIRMGVSLRDSGITMSQLGHPRVSWYHPKDRMYVLNAEELAGAIARSNIQGLGPKEIIRGDDVRSFTSILYGRTGIIFFKDYWYRGRKVPDGNGGMKSIKEARATGDHIDVWNGYRTSAKWLIEWFSWLGYSENYGKSREIWFWEVK